MLHTFNRSNPSSIMKRTTFSVVFFCKKTKLTKKGTAPIYARITTSGQISEIHTQCQAVPGHRNQRLERGLHAVTARYSPEKKIGIDRMVLSCCTVPAGRIRLSTHNFCTMSRSVETGREKTAVPVRGAVAPPDRVWQASPVNQTGTNRNDPSPYFGKGGFIPPVFSAKRGSVRCRDVFLRECKAHPAGRGSAPLPCCERPSSCC